MYFGKKKKKKGGAQTLILFLDCELIIPYEYWFKGTQYATFFMKI